MMTTQAAPAHGSIGSAVKGSRRLHEFFISIIGMFFFKTTCLDHQNVCWMDGYLHYEELLLNILYYLINYSTYVMNLNFHLFNF